MNAIRDDDALNWAGDDEWPVVPEGTERLAPEPVLPEGWTVPQSAATHGGVAAPRTEPPAANTPDSTDASAASSGALVGMGVLAGIYLLYSIGWFIGVARLAQSASLVVNTADPVADFMTSLGGWLAIAAPVVWFGSTFWLTTTRPRARWVFLLLGVVVLIPLPFLMSGVAS
jgi:hypothetical protein